MSSNVIVDKSFKFSIRIIKIYKYLVDEKREWVLGKQLLRSGTSIGANVMEGVHGVSKADFKNKLGIEFKEAKETEYWLQLLIASNILEQDDFDVSMAVKECDEICRILSKIIKTCNDQLSNK